MRPDGLKSRGNPYLKELEKLGNTVILAEAYKSLFPMNEKAVEELIQKIENREIDAITFTSPLTVENFFTIAEDKQKIAKLLSENLLTVCIGPITAKVLDKYDVAKESYWSEFFAAYGQFFGPYGPMGL